jgi:hypothetical protein
MSNEFEEQGPLDSVEEALAGFTPAPPQVDRDRLMFLAGQASCSPLAPQADTVSRIERTSQKTRRWLWPASTAALAATSLALAVALLVRPTPQPQIVYRDRPVLAEPASDDSPPAAVDHRIAQQTIAPASRIVESPPIQSGYLKTRRVALRLGIDGLGTPASGVEAASPATYLDLLTALAGAPAAGPAEPASSPTM